MSDLQSWQTLLQPNNPNFLRSSKWSQQLFLIESSFNYFDSEGSGEHPNLPYQVDIPDEDSSAKNLSSLGSTFLKEDASDKISELPEKRKTVQVKKKGGCKCKKSFCLKSYCDCYSFGGFCSPNCGCFGCKNTLDKIDEVMLSRQNKKPLNSKTNHSCNCKKSKCSKNYCQCFNAGVPCGQHCSCSGCDNCQGRQKNGKFLDGEVWNLSVNDYGKMGK